MCTKIAISNQGTFQVLANVYLHTTSCYVYCKRKSTNIRVCLFEFVLHAVDVKCINWNRCNALKIEFYVTKYNNYR